MTIKQKIWSIPFITILIFSVWMAITYNSSSYIYTSLQRIDVINYPYLRHLQTLSDSLSAIQDIFLDAVDTESERLLTRAHHNAEDFRNTVLEISKIDEKKEASQEIMAQFNIYFFSADYAASMVQMIAALNKLKALRVIEWVNFRVFKAPGAWT